MKILILGATGRTGKLVLAEALHQGHHVNCLARNSHRIPKKDGLTVYEGNPTNKSDLEKAIEGCDAVIGVLNISRKSDFPWSSIRTPEYFLSESMRELTKLMKEKNIKRISICSAWGVGDSRNDIPKWFKWFIDNSNIGVAYKDHERQETLLEKSTLDWTIVRPVGLTNHKGEEKIETSFENEPKPSLLISRKSVASYLVRSLVDSELVHKKVVISKKQLTIR